MFKKPHIRKNSSDNEGRSLGEREGPKSYTINKVIYFFIYTFLLFESPDKIRLPINTLEFVRSRNNIKCLCSHVPFTEEQLTKVLKKYDSNDQLIWRSWIKWSNMQENMVIRQVMLAVGSDQLITYYTSELTYAFFPSRLLHMIKSICG